MDKTRILMKGTPRNVIWTKAIGSVRRAKGCGGQKAEDAVRKVFDECYKDVSPIRD